MRGTGYAVVEIIWWLFIAAIIGFLIGWILRRWSLVPKLNRECDAKVETERKKAKKLESEMGVQIETIAGLQTDVSKANTQWESTNGKLRDKTSELEQAQSSMQGLTTNIANLETTTRDLESSLSTRDSRISKLEGAISESDGRIVDLEAAISKRDGQIASLDTELNGLRTDLNDANTKVASIADLESSLNQRNTRVDELEALISERDARIAGVDGKLNGLRADLNDANIKVSMIAGLESTLDSRHARIGELETTVLKRSNRVTELEAALADCKARSSVQAKEVSTKNNTSDQEQLPDKDTAIRMVGEIASRTRGGGARVDDDLKKIHGVGPKIEGLLKSMDITSFRQVAGFTSEDVTYVTAALDGFPGRIERDDWMSSAADEHRKKYNESV